MKTAVIKTGGKQYVVTEGQQVKVERLPQKAGEAVQFDEVLLTATDKTTKLGTPTVSGARVEGEVIRRGRHKPVSGVKMKPKKRHKQYYTHKQPYTEVKITKIATR